MTVEEWEIAIAGLVCDLKRILQGSFSLFSLHYSQEWVLWLCHLCTILLKFILLHSLSQSQYIPYVPEEEVRDYWEKHKEHTQVWNSHITWLLDTTVFFKSTHKFDSPWIPGEMQQHRKHSQSLCCQHRLQCRKLAFHQPIHPSCHPRTFSTSQSSINLKKTEKQWLDKFGSQQPLTVLNQMCHNAFQSRCKNTHTNDTFIVLFQRTLLILYWKACHL